MQALDLYQRQIATGRKINLPSDDPAGIVRSLRLRSSLNEGSKYINNLGESINFLETTDAAMGNITDILHRVRELTVKASNSTNDTGALSAIAEEIEELNKQIKMIANTTYGSKYIFAGRNVTEAPQQGDKWMGNEFELEYEIGIGVTIPVNIKMKDFFIGTEPNREEIIISDPSILQGLYANNLQAGDYSLETDKITGPADAQFQAMQKHIQGAAFNIWGESDPEDPLNISIIDAASLSKNASIELTVSSKNTSMGTVTYSYIAHEYDRDTGKYEKKIGEFTLKEAESKPVNIGSLRLDITTVANSTQGLSIGDKSVFKLSAAQAGGSYDQVNINYGGETIAAFVFKEDLLNNKSTDFNFFTVDKQGLTFDSNISADIGGFNPALAEFSTKLGIFAMMEKIVEKIRLGAGDKISMTLGDIDKKMEQLLSTRSTIGARVNRLELQKNRLESTQISYAGLLSQNEDVDMAEVIMRLKIQENIFQASLSAGARIIQPSLLDFLR